MARKKTPKNNKPNREKPAGRSPPGGGILRFFISRPVRNFILIIIVIALLAVFHDSVYNFFQDLRKIFGWGVLFLLGAVITLITLAWRRQLGTFVHHWNRWLGGIAFVLAVWGILGSFSASGESFPKGLGEASDGTSWIILITTSFTPCVFSS